MLANDCDASPVWTPNAALLDDASDNRRTCERSSCSNSLVESVDHDHDAPPRLTGLVAELGDVDRSEENHGRLTCPNVILFVSR